MEIVTSLIITRNSEWIIADLSYFLLYIVILYIFLSIKEQRVDGTGYKLQ